MAEYMMDPATDRPIDAGAPATSGMTPEQRRYRLNQLMRQRKDALRGLSNLGPSIGQTPQQAAAREALIQGRLDAEDQIRPLDTLEAASRPRLSAGDPRAIAGRRDLANQAASILSQQQPTAVPATKTPADFADEARMRSMGLNPASASDKSTFQTMQRLTSQTSAAAGTGTPTGQDAANAVQSALRASSGETTAAGKTRYNDMASMLMRPAASAPAPAAATRPAQSADAIFNEFNSAAALSSESEVADRKAREQRVADATYAANRQEGQRQRSESAMREMQRLAMRQAAAPVDAAEASVAEARANARSKEVGTRLTEEFGPRRAEAEIGQIIASSRVAQTKSEIELEQAKQAMDALKKSAQDRSPEFQAAERLVSQLQAVQDIKGDLASDYSPLNTGERADRVRKITADLNSVYAKLTPAQREAVARGLSLIMPDGMPEDPVQPSLWNFGDVIGRDISRIRAAMGGNSAAARNKATQDMLNMMMRGQQPNTGE